jgi:hypothetical protein
LLSARDAGGNNYVNLYYQNDDTLAVVAAVGGVAAGQRVSSAKYRDPSAWMHVVLRWDALNSSAKIYVNGTEVSYVGAGDANPTNQNYYVNTISVEHNMGVLPTGHTNILDGYLSDVYFVDGQALTPSSFGETNSDGVWVPKGYAGTYGTNGFHLDFKDAAVTAGSNAGLGKDVSGNGNYWTTNNISVTAGVTYDSMVDTPTNNYATLNPLDFGAGTLSEANLRYDVSAATRISRSTQALPSTGQWYWEVLVTAVGASTQLGVAGPISSLTNYLGSGVDAYSYAANAVKYNSGSSSAYGATYTTNDIIAFAYDAGAGTLTAYKNNATQGTMYSSLSGTLFPAVGYGSGTSAGAYQINFGQRPFTYTPPTGYKALCTANLPAVAIPKPALHFDANTRTGTGASFSVTGKQLAPDFVWTKERSGAGTDGHRLFSRGLSFVYTYLDSSSTGAETNNSNNLTALNSDGFSGGSGVGTVGFNDSGAAYVDWLWKANGAGASNTDGSITSTVSANQTAGFSIVTYTGTGANATVGHGLGVAPKMVIVKQRGAGTNDWYVYTAMTGATNYLLLNSTVASSPSATAAWNGTAPTSTVFSLGNGAGPNSATTYVAYCFAEIAGYSKFGSYVGNGSTDGPFVFCGFRPRFIMLKATTAIAGNWVIHDTARNTYNDNSAVVYPNLSNAETTISIDVLANGFKVRNNSTNENNTGSDTYIFAAFAEFPMGGSNVSPSPAR